MTTITRESFSEAIEAAVAERGPDFIYPLEWKEEFPGNDDPTALRCVYFKEGVGPACIIGVALDKLGVDVEKIVNSDASTILSALGATDLGLLRAADLAQNQQDLGRPWVDALADYQETLERYPRADAD